MPPKLLSAIDRLQRQEDELAAMMFSQIMEYQTVPAIQCVSAMPKDEQEQEALVFHEECSLFAKYVYVCYFCNKYMVGGMCFSHHTIACARNHSYHWWLPPMPAAHSFRWLNCDRCIRQAVFAACHHLLPQAKLTVHWARLVSKFILRQQQLSAWRCATVNTCAAVPLEAPILAFL